MTSGDRYSRQVRLADVGEAGQERLANASVVVVGAGGLGSPALHLLAGAGVGTIGVVDFDRVDVSNLHRQTLYSTDDVGDDKVDAATRRIEAVNPDVTVRPHRFKLDGSNARDLLQDYDLVLDGSDTFTTRYAVNEASVQTSTPNVFASVSQFSGQASVFGTKTGPCYRCLFPEPPPMGLIPNCDEGGVLGVVPAVLGTIQATEALKLLLGIGTPLVGRLLMVDTLDMTSREIVVDKDPECRTCGSGARLEPDRAVDRVTSRQLRDRIEAGYAPVLLDVRSADEREAAHIGGLSIPLDRLEDEAGRLEAFRDRDVVVYCASGVRSERAARFLAGRGYSVASLEGGMRSWTALEP